MPSQTPANRELKMGWAHEVIPAVLLLTAGAEEPWLARADMQRLRFAGTFVHQRSTLAPGAFESENQMTPLLTRFWKGVCVYKHQHNAWRVEIQVATVAPSSARLVSARARAVLYQGLPLVAHR